MDDCIAKYLYMKSMTGKVKQLKDEGKPMPKDYQQLEREFGKILISAVPQAALTSCSLLLPTVLGKVQFQTPHY